MLNLKVCFLCHVYFIYYHYGGAVALFNGFAIEPSNNFSWGTFSYEGKHAKTITKNNSQTKKIVKQYEPQEYYELSLDLENDQYIYIPKKTLDYYEKQLIKANTQGNTEKQIVYLCKIGYLKKDPDGDYFKEALSIAQVSGNSAWLIKAHLGLGNAYIDQKKNYSEALRLSRILGDQHLQVQAHLGLGNARVDQEKNYSEALRLSQSIGDKRFQAQAYLGLGKARVNQEQNYNKALELAKKIKDRCLEKKIKQALYSYKEYMERKKINIFIEVISKVRDFRI